VHLEEIPKYLLFIYQTTGINTLMTLIAHIPSARRLVAAALRDLLILSRL